MKNAHLRLIHILIMTMALLATHSALAQEVLVTSADPAEALQGTLDLEVTIGGSGFDDSAEVEFLVAGTNDPGGITVKKWKVRGPKKIIATIDISGTATVADFDIQVRLSGGRGGKGTTFRVQAKEDGVYTRVSIAAGYYRCDGDGLECVEMEEASPWNGPYSSTYHHPFGEGWDNWVDNVLAATPRECVAGLWTIHPPTGGRYDCTEVTTEVASKGGRLSIDMSSLQETWVDITTGNYHEPGFCQLLNIWDDWKPGEPLQFGVNYHDIGFMQGCTADGCPIEINASSYSNDPQKPNSKQLHPFRDLSVLPGDIADLPNVYKLSFKGLPEDGTEIPVDLPDAGELNFFTKTQVLPIKQFWIRFENARGKVMGSCITSEVDNVYFVTHPK